MTNTGTARDVLYAIGLAEDMAEGSTATGLKRLDRAARKGLDCGALWRMGRFYLNRGGTLRGIYRGEFLR